MSAGVLKGGRRTRLQNENNPFISIITITYNRAESLKKTIESVSNQTFDNYQFIVIDGGSKDSTVEILKSYQDNIDYWISERDNGIADAMNKGLDIAKGMWIYFLNSDDMLYSDKVLFEISTYLNDQDLAYGNVIYNTGRIFISNLDHRILLTNTVHHQGAFYNRKIFEKYRYSKTYKVLGDYDLNLFISKHYKYFTKLPLIIASCLEGGISRDVSLGKYLEEARARYKYYGAFLGMTLGIYSILKYAIKKVTNIR